MSNYSKIANIPYDEKLAEKANLTEIQTNIWRWATTGHDTFDVMAMQNYSYPQVVYSHAKRIYKKLHAVKETDLNGLKLNSPNIQTPASKIGSYVDLFRKRIAKNTNTSVTERCDVTLVVAQYINPEAYGCDVVDFINIYKSINSTELEAKKKFKEKFSRHPVGIDYVHDLAKFDSLKYLGLHSTDMDITTLKGLLQKKMKSCNQVNQLIKGVEEYINNRLDNLTYVDKEWLESSNLVHINNISTLSKVSDAVRMLFLITVEREGDLVAPTKGAKIDDQELLQLRRQVNELDALVEYHKNVEDSIVKYIDYKRLNENNK